MAFKDYTGLIGDTVGGGLSFFAKQEERKGLQAQADALKEKGYTDLEIAKLTLKGKELELQTALASGNKKSGGNTTLYIALGVGGVLILGLVIFAVTRKKA